MDYIKYFEDWDGTIKAGQKEVSQLWRLSAKMPERFINYIQKEIAPVECRLEGNAIYIGKKGDKLCYAKMPAGFNMFRSIEISYLTIFLSFGPGSMSNYFSEDGYFNTTIYINDNNPYDGKSYLFTSETIEDLCEFLNKIFKEGVIEFNEPD